MIFTVREVGGTDRQCECSLPVAVGGRRNILGMDQLAVVGARVEWSPARQDGDLILETA